MRWCIAAFARSFTHFAPAVVNDRLWDPRGDEPHGEPFTDPQIQGMLDERAGLTVGGFVANLLSLVCFRYSSLR